MQVRRGLERVEFGSGEGSSMLDGMSSPIVRLRQDIACVAADADVSVLIVGESGTGKERVARAIHRHSPRRRAPFVAVNCAGLASSLVEDELFGHVKGAFTGAFTDRPGPFERGHRGTVFLDEIGDLAPDSQMKLLRVLQQRTVQRLGGTQEVAFDVRIVAATNVDLAAATAAGRFREDLYYRLHVFELSVPALRDRGEDDLRELTRVVLAGLAGRRGRPVPSLAPAAWDALRGHTWPGNVRELENALERMLVAANGAPALTSAHLPVNFGRATRAGPRPGPIVRPWPAREPPGEDEVRSVLRQCGSVRRQAAEALGLSRHQLYRLLKRQAISASTSSPRTSP